MRKAVHYMIIIFQIMLIISLVKGIQLAVRARERVGQLQEERDKLQREKQNLTEELSYVQSEYYLEKVAREELQMVQPGETVVLIPQDVTEKKLAESNIEQKKDLPNYLKWWEVISGKIQ